MKTQVANPKKKNAVAAIKNNHIDPKGKAKLYDDGFTRVKNMRKKITRLRYASPMRSMWNNFNNNNCYIFSISWLLL